MTPLESLTKKLHALLPELLEPNKGCKVRWGQIVAELAGFSITRCEWLFLNEHGNIVPTELRLEDAEILGHPITLEHVLKAIQKCFENWTGFFVNQYGIFYEMLEEIKLADGSMAPILKYKHMGWTLGSTLDKQSPELIEWLDNLIPDQPTK